MSAAREQVRRRVARDIVREITLSGMQESVRELSDLDQMLPHTLRFVMQRALLGVEELRDVSSKRGLPRASPDVIWPGYIDRNDSRVELNRYGKGYSSCLFSRDLVNNSRAPLRFSRIWIVELAFQSLLQLSIADVAKPVASTNRWIGEIELDRRGNGYDEGIISLSIRISDKPDISVEELHGVVSIQIPASLRGSRGLAREIRQCIARLGVFRWSDTAGLAPKKEPGDWPWHSSSASVDFALAAYDVWLATVFCSGRQLADRVATLISEVRSLLPSSGLAADEQRAYSAQLDGLARALANGGVFHAQDLLLSDGVCNWTTYNVDIHESPNSNARSVGSIMSLSFGQPGSFAMLEEATERHGVAFRTALTALRMWDEATVARLRRDSAAKEQLAHTHGYRRISTDLFLERWPMNRLFDVTSSGSGDDRQPNWRLKPKYQGLLSEELLIEPAAFALATPAAVQLLLASPVFASLLPENIRQAIINSESALPSYKKDKRISDVANEIALVWAIGALRGMLQFASDRHSTAFCIPKSRVQLTRDMQRDAELAAEQLKSAMLAVPTLKRSQRPCPPVEHDELNERRRRLLAAFLELGSNTFRHLKSTMNSDGRTLVRELPSIAIEDASDSLRISVRNSCNVDETSVFGGTTLKHVNSLLDTESRLTSGKCEIRRQTNVSAVLTLLTLPRLWSAIL